MDQNISQTAEIQTPQPPPAEPRKKSRKILYIAGGIIVFLLLLVGAFFLLNWYIRQAELGTGQVACTEEAKICPDGSAVGRVAPSCEFAPCPTVSFQTDPTANWDVFQAADGFSFKYPKGWFLEDMTNVGTSDYIFLLHLSNQNNIGVDSYVLRVSKEKTDIERAVRFLNYGDAGLLNSAETTKDSLNGVEITKAIVTFSQYNPSTNEYIEENKSYQILVPDGKNTIRIYTDPEHQELANQILSTFKFNNSQAVSPTSPGGTYLGHKICQTDSECVNGEKCLEVGIGALKPPYKTCWEEEVIPQ